MTEQEAIDKINTYRNKTIDIYKLIDIERILINYYINFNKADIRMNHIVTNVIPIVYGLQFNIPKVYHNFEVSSKDGYQFKQKYTFVTYLIEDFLDLIIKLIEMRPELQIKHDKFYGKYSN